VTHVVEQGGDVDASQLGAIALSTLEHTSVVNGAMDTQIYPERMETDGLISTHTDFGALKTADVIVVATNSSDEELIRPEHVKDGAIVCGTSVPSNLSKSFTGDARVTAFDGGFAKLPDGSQINFVGMPTDGMAYGCLAETLVLGFDGLNHSFSKGPLTTDQVYAITEIAQTHNFDLGTLKFDDSPLDI
jgi:predicted amino acid dehydrogenase